MPDQQPSGYEDALVQGITDAVEQQATQIAAEHGAPAGSRAPTHAERVRFWGRTDPNVDEAELLSKWMAGGLSPDEIPNLLLVKNHPEIPELGMAFTQPPPDPETASAMVRLARYPFRLGLINHLDPKQRVAEANALDRAWQRTQAAPSAEPLPVGG